ncbi:hypothetical protein P7228_14040 [Altererythrobacter arenosus]|uniref:Tetratricopeptide repeat protein n=1 Tax=Altererythrobacter arenosus TaxID=3032592 RepID=A0ABY8FQ07_9SPHN|nr:hypothetical protein [Altererythrobacter sp. CAU 1644]WFL77097.1 hypothetical protein P7228_14040 [Altererythrobacter sp. CAU 1644]
MRSFVASQRASKMRGSSFALAVALAMGTAVGVTGFAEPAHAAKKEKKAKSEYSKEFIAAYKPIEEAFNTEGADLAALKGQFPTLVSLSQSADERFATGNLLYNAGVKTQDQTLQLQGMELMLGSGKVAPEQAGQFNFVAYQLAYAGKQNEKARAYLQKAMDANYANERVSAADLQAAMAETYLSEGRHEEGVRVLTDAIAARKAAGLPVEENWYQRGLSVAYNNKVQPAVYDVIAVWLADYPSEANWRDSVNIARNLNDFQSDEMLDLLRLSYRVNAMKNKVEYIDFIDAADPRKLPKEVEMIIEKGYSSGLVSKDDIYVSDSLKTAKGRIASDRAELPSLERDARASSASLRTVIAAGDAFLSYGEYAKAEEFYRKGLGMPGAAAAQTQTRLGIALTEQGKYDAALEAFGKVDGRRAAIARLWSTYVHQKMGHGG